MGKRGRYQSLFGTSVVEEGTIIGVHWEPNLPRPGHKKVLHSTGPGGGHLFMPRGTFYAISIMSPLLQDLESRLIRFYITVMSTT